MYVSGFYTVDWITGVLWFYWLDSVKLGHLKASEHYHYLTR